MAKTLKMIPPPKLDKKATAADPLNLAGRLYQQIDSLLLELENPEGHVKITLKERIAALIAVGRLQVAFVALRKEKVGEDEHAGASVRKYASAFADAAGRRAARAGSAPDPEPDEGLGLDDLGGDDDGDAA